MEKGKGEQELLFYFGFDMEILAVGVPYAYGSSRFSPFLNEDCAS